MNKTQIAASLALGSVLGLSLVGGVAQAGNTVNTLFQMTEISAPMLIAAEKTAGHKCGTGACGKSEKSDKHQQCKESEHKCGSNGCPSQCKEHPHGKHDKHDKKEHCDGKKKGDAKKPPAKTN